MPPSIACITISSAPPAWHASRYPQDAPALSLLRYSNATSAKLIAPISSHATRNSRNPDAAVTHTMLASIPLKNSQNAPSRPSA